MTPGNRNVKEMKKIVLKKIYRSVYFFLIFAIEMKEALSKSERTRQLIIEKTAPVFNMKGYAGTSMSDLTEATGLTKGSIYGNFKDKEEVALEAFRHNAKIRKNAIATEINAAQTYTEKLMVLTRIFHSSNIRIFPKGGCPLINTGAEADDTHEELRKAVSAELLQWKKDISTIIKKGISAGEFRHDVVIEKFALSVIALVEGGIFIAGSTKNPAFLDTVLQTIKDMIHSISV